MKRLTGCNVKLGFVDSDTLPSYSAIYEQLQKYENLFEDKEVVSVKELPQKRVSEILCLVKLILSKRDIKWGGMPT